MDSQPLCSSNHNSTKSHLNQHSIPKCNNKGSKRETSKLASMAKYNLRTKSIQYRIEVERRKSEPRHPKPKQRPAPLSKYRRKTANLRERCRMQEMNDAFQRLRSVVPDITQTEDDNKSTKINTLKMAVSYISALTQMLKQSENSSSNLAISSETFDKFSFDNKANQCDLLGKTTLNTRSLILHSESGCNQRTLDYNCAGTSDNRIGSALGSCNSSTPMSLATGFTNSHFSDLSSQIIRTVGINGEHWRADSSTQEDVDNILDDLDAFLGDFNTDSLLLVDDLLE